MFFAIACHRLEWGTCECSRRESRSRPRASSETLIFSLYWSLSEYYVTSRPLAEGKMPANIVQLRQANSTVMRPVGRRPPGERHLPGPRASDRGRNGQAPSRPQAQPARPPRLAHRPPDLPAWASSERGLRPALGRSRPAEAHHHRAPAQGQHRQRPLPGARRGQRPQAAASAARGQGRHVRLTCSSTSAASRSVAWASAA